MNSPTSSSPTSSSPTSSSPASRPIRPRQSATWPRRVVLAVTVVLQCVALYSPRAPGVGSGFGFDKLGHAAIFGLVTAAALACGYRPVLVAAAGLLQALATEFVQAQLWSARSGDWGDVLADTVGIAGVLTWRAILGPDPQTAADRTPPAEL